MGDKLNRRDAKYPSSSTVLRSAAGCTKSVSTNAQYAPQQKVGPISIYESLIF